MGVLSFQAPNWLARPDAVTLSCSLPLQAEPFDDHGTRPFFAGLLPEGQLRRLIARQFQVSSQNDFALLDHIGGECAGAVTLLERGRGVPNLDQDVEWLSDGEVVAILDELPQRPMLAGKDGLRLSLAGAQDMPLSPAQAQMLAVLGREFLLVERYDRTIDICGQRQRLHQGDFCQALGVVPETKYQNEGGPDLTHCFELLRRATRPSAPPVLRMLDYVIFNALMANHDAHAKNLLLLYDGKFAVLAPLYDLLSTAVYPGVFAQILTLIEHRCALTVQRLSVPAGDMDDETASS